MKLTVLGGWGAWPPARGACSGYLLEEDGFRLLIDPGYATLPRLLEVLPAEDVDAVLVGHGHPDHCADLNPLLRARSLGGASPAPLPVHTLAGALDAVLALDRPRMLAGAYDLREFAAGEGFELGPFAVETAALPHFVPDAGFRLAAAGRVLAYTGDSSPSSEIARLARDADLLLAEATFAERVPAEQAGGLSTAVEAGDAARGARVAHLILTHLWPGSDPNASLAAARTRFDGQISVAGPGLVVDLD